MASAHCVVIVCAQMFALFISCCCCWDNVTFPKGSEVIHFSLKCDAARFHHLVASAFIIQMLSVWISNCMKHQMWCQMVLKWPRDLRVNQKYSKHGGRHGFYTVFLEKKTTYLTSLLTPGSKEHEKVHMFVKKVKHDPRFHMSPSQLLQVQIDRFH